MLPEFSCAGKVAIVTGAGRGIGKAIALGLAEAGADVVVTARTESALVEVTKQISALGRRAHYVVMDVTVPEQADRMVEEAMARMGKVDILVNNAGNILHKPLVPLAGGTAVGGEGRITDLEWSTVIATNLTGVFYCIRAVGPHLVRQNYGKIVIMSSVLGRRGGRYVVPYAATKGAMLSIAQSLALEWAPYHVNVNCIAPGLTATELALADIEDRSRLEKNLRLIPLRRMAEPREIALAAVYLASPASDYMTGQVLALDGGSSA